MKYSVKYGTKDIEFNIEFKNRKTISISVEPPKNITVVAPVGTSEEEIKAVPQSRCHHCCRADELRSRFAKFP